MNESNMMKNIVLDYYSRKNFGDDLFVYLFVKHFGTDYSIRLLGNPFCGIPDELRSYNITFSFSSYIATVLAFIGSKIHPIEKITNKLYYKILDNTKAHSLIYVKIGGSIFMDRKAEKEITFGLDSSIERSFDIASQLNAATNHFIVGANLGPAYHEHYWNHIKKVFSQYAHVTLRDYSSYFKVQELGNTQYAPDIGSFLYP